MVTNRESVASRTPSFPSASIECCASAGLSESQIDTKLAAYATTSSLNTKLAACTTTSSLNTKLAAYATTSLMNTKLNKMNKTVTRRMEARISNFNLLYTTVQGKAQTALHLLTQVLSLS